MANGKDKERSSVISITIKDKRALFMAYMPFIKNGGLFIPTQKPCELGDEMFLLVNLMDEPDPISISGKVVWVTPEGALDNRPQGVGIQFTNEDADKTVHLIESKLGATLSLTRSTHTF